MSHAKRIIIAIIFGLAGFGINLLDVELPLEAHLKTNVLFGLIFPLLITLSWGWRYGLLAALAGGCQSMWWLWQNDGWGIIYAVPVYTLWILWHGIWADRRRLRKKHFWYESVFFVEIPFRVVVGLGFLTIFPWLFSMNPPPWNPAISSAQVQTTWIYAVIFKHIVTGYFLILAGYSILSLGPVRRFFGLAPVPVQRVSTAIYAGAVLTGLFLWFVEALSHYLLFNTEGQNFWDIAILQADQDEIFMRLLYLVVSLAAGVLIERFVRNRAIMSQHLDRINRVLSAIRNVNQLITQEKDTNSLLEKACRLLIETRGYYNAWIALVDGKSSFGPLELGEIGSIKKYYHAGFDDEFAPMAECLQRGELPTCARTVLTKNELYIVDDPFTFCSDCPLSARYSERASFCMRLEHAGRIFGWLSVSIPKYAAGDQDEQDLFSEVCNDIAFALWSIDTERQRQSMEREYKSVLSETSDAVLACDLDGKITVFNKGAERLLGISAEKVLSRPVSVFCPKNRLPEQDELICRVREVGSVEAFETERLTIDNRIVPVEITLNLRTDNEGRPVGISAIMRDVTERKRAEKELRENEEKFKHVIANIPIGISLTLSSGKIQANKAFYKMLGYSEGLSGVQWQSVTHPEDMEESQKIFEAVIAGEMDTARFTKRYIHRDGHVIWADVSTAARRDEQGSLLYLMTAISDITDRKRMEDELRAGEQQLRAANQQLQAHEQQLLAANQQLRAGEQQLLAANQQLQAGEQQLQAAIQQLRAGEQQLEAANQQLRHANLMFKIVLDTIPVRVFWKDREGRYLGCNSLFARDAGLERPEEIVGKTDFELAWVEQAELYRHDDARVISSGQERLNYEEPQTTPDGRRLILRTSKVPLLDSDRRIVGMLGTYEDITERKQAQEKLAETKALLQAALDNSQAGIAIADAPDGRLRYVNDAGLMIRGKSKEEIVEGVGIKEYVSSWQILHLDGTPYREDEVPLARAVLFGERCSEEFIVRRADEEDRIVWANAAPVKNAQGDILAGIVVFLDITDRKRIEKALRESEAKFRSITENAMDFIFIKDHTGRFTFVNPSLRELLGLSMEEIVGKTTADLFGRDQGRFIDDIDRRVFSGETINETGTLSIQDRNMFFNTIQTPLIVKDGAVHSIMGIARDVSDMKKREEELQFQAMLLNEIRDHIMATDPEGHIVYMNKSHCELLGKTRQELLGQTLNVYGDDDRSHASQEQIRQATLARGSWRGDVFYVNAENKEIVLDCRTWLLHDEAGQPRVICSISTDITELRDVQMQMYDYQEKLKGLVSELTVAEENERKRIASELHDDIAQVMVFIKMKVDSLLEYENDDAIKQDILMVKDGLADSLKRIQSLTNELGVPILYELGLLEALEAFMSEEMKCRHNINATLETDGSETMFNDGIKIFVFRSLRELLINVIKYAQATEVSVTINGDNEHVRIAVSDNGVGFQKAQKGIGSGFGLFSIRERARYLGGQLTISSEADKGSCVTIEIPRRVHPSE